MPNPSPLESFNRMQTWNFHTQRWPPDPLSPLPSHACGQGQERRMLRVTYEHDPSKGTCCTWIWGLLRERQDKWGIKPHCPLLLEASFPPSPTLWLGSNCPATLGLCIPTSWTENSEPAATTGLQEGASASRAMLFNSKTADSYRFSWVLWGNENSINKQLELSGFSEARSIRQDSRLWKDAQIQPPSKEPIVLHTELSATVQGKTRGCHIYLATQTLVR